MPRKKTTKTTKVKIEKLETPTPPPAPIEVPKETSYPVVKSRKSRQTFLVIIFSVIICVLIAFVAFSFYYQNTLAPKSYSSIEEETSAIILSISQFMDLPQNEIPQLATVLDEEKLTSQPFFQGAKNGDKLLMYKEAKQAILYRPSNNRIIAVAPFASQEQSNASAEIKVAYYNGTTIKGLASQIAKKISDAYPNYQTATTANAANNDYTQTIVIDLTGGHESQVENIIKLTEGKMGTLPETENKPDADILIILGK